MYHWRACYNVLQWPISRKYSNILSKQDLFFGNASSVTVFIYLYSCLYASLFISLCWYVCLYIVLMTFGEKKTFIIKHAILWFISNYDFRSTRSCLILSSCAHMSPQTPFCPKPSSRINNDFLET